MTRGPTIGTWLIQSLERLGVRHVFGVPGDYSLRFCGLIERSRLKFIGTTTEQAAGFAADAYARLNGLGVVCVTYCVGGLNVTNPVAEAYAEKSPVVVISGAPGVGERERMPLLHHRIRDFATQREIFERITVASAVLSDPARAREDVDRVLGAALRVKRPVYLELPRDRVDLPLPRSRAAERRGTPSPSSDPAALREALAEAAAMLRAARRPVILAGVEIHRFGLQDTLARLIDRTALPVAADMLGKSVVSEVHPRYLGVYGGAFGREDVRKAVESSDGLLMLGVFMTDINFGLAAAHLDEGRTISATSERVSVRRHVYERVSLGDFVHGLLRVLPARRRGGGVKPHPVLPPPFRPSPRAPVTISRLFAYLNAHLTDDMVVIADTGDALFAAMDLTIHRRTEFFAPAYYTSMGFAVPAAVGVQCARPSLRPLVLVGDGAFQMTGLELSTAVRLRQDPIVVVLNNRGYTTERLMLDGRFNDIPEWRYERVPDLIGGGRGVMVRTEGEMDLAFRKALGARGTPWLLNVRLDPQDRSRGLERIARRFAAQVRTFGPGGRGRPRRARRAGRAG